MIGNGWKSTRAASFATLLDLAARGHVVGRLVIGNAPAAVLLPDVDDDRWRTPFESLVIDEARRSRRGARPVPAQRSLLHGVWPRGDQPLAWSPRRTPDRLSLQPPEPGTLLNDRALALAVALGGALEVLTEALTNPKFLTSVELELNTSGRFRCSH
jgi:hypothetical protein